LHIYNTIFPQQLDTKLSSTIAAKKTSKIAWFSDWLDKTRRRTVDGLCLRFWTHIFEKCYLWPWPDPWTRDPENLISLWPDYIKYLCQFWITYIQWFKRYRIEISMAIASWPWPLNQWPCQCHQSNVDLSVIHCGQFH